MSVEKTLKNQARSILAKNNWQKSIVGFLCVCTVFGIIYSIIELSTMLITDDMLSKPLNMAIMIAVALLCGVGFILLTPIYTGYVRFIANSKNNETGDIQDIFYYFNKGRYIDTVQLNLCLFIRYAVLFILCALPVTACLILEGVMPNYWLAFEIGAVWTGIIGIVAYFMLSRFWVMTQYLYVADFDYRKESEIIKASSYVVKKNFGKILSLYISFILYGLLCFFVLPIVFVYPYFKHTTVLSYSYIYQMETKNPKSLYFKQETEEEDLVADKSEDTTTEESLQDKEEISDGLDETSNDKTVENITEFDNN